MRKRQESEPAMISVNVSYQLCLSKVKYHQPKSAKGEKTVNPFSLMRSNKIPWSRLFSACSHNVNSLTISFECMFF